MMRYIFISMLLFFTTNLFSQQVSISADKKRIRIGDEITLKFDVKAPSKTTLVWPEMNDTLGSHFEILKQNNIDTLSDKVASELVLQQRVIITSFDSGSYQIPKLLFEFKTTQGVDSLYTDPLSFSILTVPVDTTLEIKDVRDVLDVPFEIGEFLPWILGGVALVGLLVAAIYFYLNKKKPVKPTAPKVVIAPWKLALQELSRIEKERIWKEGKIKLFYSEVSDCIRAYLENQFSVPALELTSDEILTQLRIRSWTDDKISIIKELLLLSDLVKFAKEKPDEVSHARSIELAKSIVNLTKPAEVEPTNGKGGDNA